MQTPLSLAKQIHANHNIQATLRFFSIPARHLCHTHTLRRVQPRARDPGAMLNLTPRPRFRIGRAMIGRLSPDHTCRLAFQALAGRELIPSLHVPDRDRNAVSIPKPDMVCNVETRRASVAFMPIACRKERSYVEGASGRILGLSRRRHLKRRLHHIWA